MTGERYAFEQSDEFIAGLERLQPGQLDRVMAFLRDHASTQPTTPLPGRLKQLRGQWRDYWQFDVSQSIRLIYRVDEELHTVFLEYLGEHPSWSRSRRGRLRR
jgi:mRNA-degrading endonuclease YafQ of YafQ-DinJ toxin-antitoxin module